MQITVTQVTENRRRQRPTSGETLGFGNKFSDHMFLMDYSRESGWRDARIVPYGPLSLAPSAMVLHYGQEIFEGMKAYRWDDGSVALFRPEENAKRFAASAQRMALPELSEADFIGSLEAATSAPTMSGQRERISAEAKPCDFRTPVKVGASRSDSGRGKLRAGLLMQGIVVPSSRP